VSPISPPEERLVRMAEREKEKIENRKSDRTRWIDRASIPPLRDPACQSSARKKKPGRSGRDDTRYMGEGRGEEEGRK